MNQRLVSDRFPYIPVIIRVGRQSHEVDALVDTGFDGDVIVPLQFVSETQFPDGFIPYRLADDSWGLATSYAGTISINYMGTFDVTIATMGDETIIGLGIINRFAVLLDHGTRVVLEP